MAPSVRLVPSHLAWRHAKRKSSAFTTASYSSEKYVPKELPTPLARICGTHLVIFLSQFNIHDCSRSPINCQHHAHPPGAPAHRHCWYRTAGRIALPHAEYDMGDKPPTHANHDAILAKRGAQYDGSVVASTLIDSDEHPHGT